MWWCKGLYITLYKYSYCDVRHILNFDNTTPCSSNVPNARNWLVFTTFFCSFWCLLFSEGTRLFIAKKTPPHRKSHKHDVFHSFWHSDAISQRYATCAALFLFLDQFLGINLYCFPTVQNLGSGSPLPAMGNLVLFVHKHPAVLYLRVCEHRMCGKSKWVHRFLARICRKVSYCTANAVLDKQTI